MALVWNLYPPATSIRGQHSTPHHLLGLCSICRWRTLQPIDAKWSQEASPCHLFGLAAQIESLSQQLRELLLLGPAQLRQLWWWRE